MARYALVKSGVVAAVVEQTSMPDTDFGGTWVACGIQVGTGSTYSGGNFSEPARLVSLSQRDFWRRFTVAEREALQDMLDTGTAAQKRKLKAFRDYVQVGMDVELFDDYIIASVAAMEAVGVIGAGRAAQILA